MMKKQKNRLRKTLALVFSAVLLVAITVGATVAYLTSSDDVHNTFTVGNVKITLDEAKTNEEGKPLKKNSEGDYEVVNSLEKAERVQKNDYHLVPGRKVAKDPTVHVQADSEECYVRVFVTVSKWNAVKTAFSHGDIFNADDINSCFNGLFDGHDMNSAAKGWWKPVNMTKDANADTVTFELRYSIGSTTITDKTVPASKQQQDLAPVFTQITLPGETTNAELAALEGMKIDVVAQAIQAEGFTDADAAWTAFEDQTAPAPTAELTT